MKGKLRSILIYMRIRLSKPDDAAALARLHRGTIRSINAQHYTQAQIAVWSGRTNARRFRDSHTVAVRYVAVEADKIIGFVDFKKEDSETFWGLYVHKDFLGRGVGSALMRKAQQVAIAMGARKFKLEATITAKAFYERMGFTVLKKAKHRIEDQDLPVYVMQKLF